MLLFLIPLALLLVYLSPTLKSRIFLGGYFVLLFLVMWGVEGFIYSEQPSINERYTFIAFFIFVLVIHLPLALRLIQVDLKKHKIKNARNFFEKDILHLSDEQLHRHLEH